METETLDDNKPVDSSSTTDATTGATSSSVPSTGAKDLSEVVQGVVDKHQGTETKVPTPPVEEEEEETEGAEKEEPSTETSPQEVEQEETEEKPLPFSDHPRWKEVLSQKNTAQAEVERLKPFAEQATMLQQFCNTNGISQEDLQSALELAALSKRDISAFRKRMGEYIENIDIVQGAKLPADLQKDVDDGTLSDARAKELAKARIQLQLAEGNFKTERERSEESRQSGIANSLNSWEEAQKKLDPSWDGRRDMLAERLQFLWQQTPPNSPQAAIKLAEQANTDVKKRLANFAPKPPKRKPLLSTGSSTNTGQPLKIDNLETDLPAVVRAIAARHR